jgi:hypothetical protein
MHIKCDTCGRFIKHSDIDAGRALFRVETVADAGGMPIDQWEAECPEHAPDLSDTYNPTISGNASPAGV